MSNPTEQEIAAVSTAPRVTQANIVSEHYFTGIDGASGTGWTVLNITETVENRDAVTSALDALGMITFCVLFLRNGFTVTGEAFCAIPDAFDADIGRKEAKANAMAKVWPLMVYALKQDLHRAT